jgi:hypothetical protein
MCSVLFGVKISMISSLKELLSLNKVSISTAYDSKETNIHKYLVPIVLFPNLILLGKMLQLFS